jgi:hypothetical protein
MARTKMKTQVWRFGAPCRARPLRSVSREMTPSWRVRFALAVTVCLSGACGQSPAGPSQDTSVQLFGQWTWAVRITTATGGDCANTLFQHSVGRVYSQTMTLQQNGSSIAAQAPATVYGVDCSFTGSVTASELSLPTSSCAPLRIERLPIPLTCSGGTVRNLHPLNVSANLRRTGSSWTGDYKERFP